MPNTVPGGRKRGLDRGRVEARKRPAGEVSRGHERGRESGGDPGAEPDGECVRRSVRLRAGKPDGRILRGAMGP